MTGKRGAMVLELCLSTSERGSDHVWPPGGHCYSSPTESAALTASAGRREGRKEKKVTRGAGDGVCVSLLALTLLGANGGTCDGREQNPYFLTQLDI